ncbi:MAG: hypothetical protein WD079_03655, partial [Phycisphaeraceae bacterium]
RMQNNTQIRGIHQAMVMFAQSNRSNFPGMDGGGQLLDATGNGGDAGDFQSGTVGETPSRRLAILLNGNFFTPEYIISPTDTNKEEWTPNDGTGTPTDVLDHYSYAMLQIGDGSGNKTDGTRPQEWSETLNTEAIVIGDRAMSDGTDIYSVHTGEESADWRGGLAHNDNSVAFETDHEQSARYGSGPLDTWHMFADEAGIDNSGNAEDGGWLVYSGAADQWSDNTP